jgi:hypothetical protein
VDEEGAAEDSAKTAWRGGGHLPSTAGQINWKERRVSPRIRCSGGVEFRADGSGVRMGGTLTDISLYGYYVEMNNTYPIDTKASLVLRSFGIRIEVTGVVRTSYLFSERVFASRRSIPTNNTTSRNCSTPWPDIEGCFRFILQKLVLLPTRSHQPILPPFSVRSQNSFAPTNCSYAKNSARSPKKFADPNRSISILQSEALFRHSTR